MKTFALLVVLAVAVAPMYALQCYSGTDSKFHLSIMAPDWSDD